MARRIVKVKVVRSKDGAVRKVPLKQAQRVSQPVQDLQASRRDLVVLEDSMLNAILADPRYMTAIPCLQTGKQALDTVGKRCGRCNRKRKTLRAEAFTQLRSCIAGLRGEQAASLKKLLGAKQVRVLQPGGRGQPPRPITL